MHVLVHVFAAMCDIMCLLQQTHLVTSPDFGLDQRFQI